MEKPSILFLLLLLTFFSVLLRYHPVVGERKEHWGYTTVRQVTENHGAHLFWWYYESGHQHEDSPSKWPIILWLEGGPGSSGALGNFIQIGPVTVDDEERPHTWLWKADLLFVDSPVGTGFSYVDHDSLLVKTDEHAAVDLLLLLKDLSLQSWANFKNRPLYIYGEGYGGKIAACLGLLVNQAILTNELELQPPGAVILADSWISPEDSAISLGPLLKDFSRISSKGLMKANSFTHTLQYQLSTGDYASAKVQWDSLTTIIAGYNVNLDNLMDPTAHLVGTTTIYGTERIMRKADLRNYSTKVVPFDFSRFMNRDIKQKLGIIPEGVTWIQWNKKVFDAMIDDYMKPRTIEVGQLLARDVSVTIINGQYDVKCSTKGAHAWVKKLTGWRGLSSFLVIDSEAYELFYSESEFRTAAFIQSHGQLAFYSILNAGHYVTFDQPDLLQLLIEKIINPRPTHA